MQDGIAYGFCPGVSITGNLTINAEMCPTIRAQSGVNTPAVTLKVRGGADTYMKHDGSVGTAGKGALVSEDVTFTIAATQDQTLFQPDNDSYIVRRLTPTECERLQGFPDGWTDIGEWTDSRGKRRKTTDGNRYKALGNSFAVPVVRWLGERIERITMTDVTNNYRKARVNAGIRAENAASELGVSITTLFSWERGDTSPSADKLIEMANLYNKKIDYLLALE